MATRPDSQNAKNLTIQPWTVAASSVSTVGMPQTLTAEKTCRDSTAGENPSGIAMESQATAGGLVQVALLTGGAIVPVQVGTGGATAGQYAVVGTTGATNQTLGGGTTVRYVLGKFNQTGVSGDLVGLTIGQFAGCSS